MPRFIAFYLPQFYPTPENDQWWGPGFTEWTNVAKARRLFPGHEQPHIPADLGFYDLRMPEVRIKQAELARQAGIEGFCYWHYWFGNGKRMLEIPFNEVLSSGQPDFPFCLAWANHSWEKKNFAKSTHNKLLIQQTYPGIADYTAHFNALLPAFRDKRYIKVNGKLFFIIYAPLASPEIPVFINLWRSMAAQNGLNDFYFVAKDSDSRNKNKLLKMGFDAIYNEDTFNIHHHLNFVTKAGLMLLRRLNIPTVFRYKSAVKYMVTDDCRNREVIPVIAPNWDHSPRSGTKHIVLHKAKPKYFKWLVKRSIDIVRDKPQDEQIIIIKSWNEWGEGNYMEPDLQYGHGNLIALREAIDEATANPNSTEL